MKLILSLFFVLVVLSTATAQQMNLQKLEEIITSVSDSIEGTDGRWQFFVDDIMFICVTDVNNNRMRIISPIIEANKLDEDLKTMLLMANFHTALDVKYAVANELLWSAFIHPFKELTEDQLYDAISQVYSANKTFGTSFTSTELVFPGASSTEEPAEKEEKKTYKKQRF